VVSAITVSLIAFAFIFGGAFIGALLRRALPDDHLGEQAKDIVRLGTGLIATVAALTLGLLVASAKNSYEMRKNQLATLTADIILLDQVLAQYGPDAREARQHLRQAIGPMIARIWREKDAEAGALPFEAGFAANAAIFGLSPQTEGQHAVKAAAIRLGTEVAKTRLLLFVEARDSLPAPFLVVLIFWLTIIFASFSLFSSLNPTVVAALSVFAFSASGAIYLIQDLGRPFWGLMQISSAPLSGALAPLEP
jgi:hypothetical protein